MFHEKNRIGVAPLWDVLWDFCCKPDDKTVYDVRSAFEFLLHSFESIKDQFERYFILVGHILCNIV